VIYCLQYHANFLLLYKFIIGTLWLFYHYTTNTDHCSCSTFELVMTMFQGAPKSYSLEMFMSVFEQRIAW